MRVELALYRDHNIKMHYRAPFDGGSRRVMHRIQGKGDAPVKRADAKTTPHPRSAQ
jgi:hypothetical protein